MISRLTWVITIIYFLTGCSGIASISPEKTPVPPDHVQKRLLKQGEQYFNQGQFKSALQQAMEVIQINPDNVEAMFSISSSYLAMNEFNDSLEFSKRASSYKSDYLPDIYLLMGRAYENMDDQWNALRTYRSAAGAYPEDSRIHFHLGTIYADLNKPEFAAESFKTAITLQPGNFASHFQLGILYYNNHYTTPALLSLSTALLLEPKEDPAPLIRNNIKNLLIRKVANAKNNDEGNFKLVDSALAERYMSLPQKSADSIDFETTKSLYHVFFTTLNNPAYKDQEQTFVLKYYVPFYGKILHQGLQETFVYYIFQGTQNDSINNWLKSNPEKVKQLEQMARQKI